MAIAIYNTLTIIDSLLSSVKGKWLLIGTTSLAIQGFPVEPNDIDILCNTEIAIVIEKLLVAYKLEMNVVPRDKFRSRFSRYKINDVIIEVMGDLEVNTINGWLKVLEVIECPIEISFQQNIFNIPGKVDQLAMYNAFNRNKDELLIKMLNRPHGSN
jgi:hypothetical protein